MCSRHPAGERESPHPSDGRLRKEQSASTQSVTVTGSDNTSTTVILFLSVRGVKKKQTQENSSSTSVRGNHESIHDDRRVPQGRADSHLPSNQGCWK